jgi:hypothetical protein
MDGRSWTDRRAGGTGVFSASRKTFASPRFTAAVYTHDVLHHASFPGLRLISLAGPWPRHRHTYGVRAGYGDGGAVVSPLGSSLLRRLFTPRSGTVQAACR